MKGRMAAGTFGVVRITARRPARAAYAAVAAPALPVEPIVRTVAPSSRALVAATDAIRSLKDHVGFRDSSLT